MRKHPCLTLGILLTMATICTFPDRAVGECSVTQTADSRRYFEAGRRQETVKRYAEALPLFLKAAEMGDGCAQLKLGFLYANALGVPSPDYGKALYWWRKAADQGVGAAEYSITMMYGRGVGVEKSESRALTLMKRAAEHGDRSAMASLGLSYSGCHLDRPKNCEIGKDMGTATDEVSRKAALYWLDRAKQNAGRNGWQAEMDRSSLKFLWYPPPPESKISDSDEVLPGETPIQAADRWCFNHPAQGGKPGEYAMSQRVAICVDGWLFRHGLR